jgi:oxygen-dependent protoporphyrinogen oxidase
MARNPQVVVIGAGIAGLVAAHRLAEAGVKVRVLEAGDTVGGRMTTDHIDGFIIDRGAQFLSTAYTHLPKLVTELGLQSAWRPTSPRAAIVRDGEPRRLNSRNPLSLATGGVLRGRELADLARHFRSLRDQVRGRSLADYGAWESLDDVDAAEWLDAEAGPAVSDYFYEPMLQGFYFQPLDGTSRALAMAVAAFGFKRPKTMTVEGGIERIPAALASSLDVRTGSPVARLDVGDKGVSIGTDTWDMEADFAILATQAHVARDLLAGGATETEAALLSCTYSPTIVVCLGVHSRYRLPNALQDVYGLLIPACERQHIAAVSIERNKSAERARRGELVEVFLSGAAADHHLDRSDVEVLAAVLPELERYLPGVGSAITMVHVVRWPAAEPRSPVGRARAIAEYRHRPRQDRRVLLAGDYLAMPWTDGAADAGAWAAAELTAHLRSATH